MKTPESYEKAEIKKYLESLGCWFFSPYMAGFGKAGVPDLIICSKGQFIAIEVKREGKQPTPLQNKRMAEIKQAGGFVYWGTAKKIIGEIERDRLACYI